MAGRRGRKPRVPAAAQAGEGLDFGGGPGDLRQLIAGDGTLSGDAADHLAGRFDLRPDDPLAKAGRTHP